MSKCSKCNIMKIAFIVNTEYHLILSLGVIQKYFPQDNICIYQVSPIGGKRLATIDTSSMGCRYELVRYDYDHPNHELKRRIDEIINFKPDMLFLYLEEKSWFTYMFSKLHKAGTKIVLMPDGMKVYMFKNIKAFKTIFRSSVKFALSNARIGIPFPIAVEAPYYASNKYIDEVWVEYPEYYNNRTKKSVVSFSLPTTKEYVNLLNRVFKFSMTADEELYLNSHPILLLDSPFSQESYYEYMVSLLRQIHNKYPSSPILIKQHPLASEQAKQYYGALGNVTYLNMSYPAELYIANARNATIVSMYSTAMLFYNPTCRYYWIGNCFKSIKTVPEIINPTQHIQVVSTIDEI